MVSRVPVRSWKNLKLRETDLDWKKEWKIFLVIAGVFLLFFYLPSGEQKFDNAVLQAIELARWYARAHVLTCLLPAFFIAGAIGVFVKKESVIKYFGAEAKKVLAYGVASVSGSVLAVCSCTVLPLFAGIYNMGAGIGPATAFLYAGPAINVMALILTTKVLGIELGIARGVGAVVFSIVIGLLMQFIYRKEELERQKTQISMPETDAGMPLIRNALLFAMMVVILVFANWGRPDELSGFWFEIYNSKWLITSVSGLVLGVMLILWMGIKWYKMAALALSAATLAMIFPGQVLIPFSASVVGLGIILATGEGEPEEWFTTTWEFTKQIMPLLFYGVLVAGFLLGRPGAEGIIPPEWISNSVGGNSVFSNLFASVSGAFMYFATLTEVPILDSLIGSGMGKGPALALLLAGPALSLPNMLVIRSVIGTKKTVTYVLLVVVMAAASGMIYGYFF